jgi:hypothetical protein
LHRCLMAGEDTTVVKFIVPDWRDKVDFDNPMLESTISLSQLQVKIA